ncbi:MAG: Hsp20/alpha crystallin family protein [Syntrophales bacterium LBB04]|nr:Hsp20/alpha crystallin family protein [Syntrophales bacterium LBB04]
MTEQTSELQKEEAPHPAAVERTRTRKVFIPAVDIYETKDSIILVADLPGADEKSVGITLEKNVLTITAEAEHQDCQGYSASLIEYNTGDYQRSFTVSDEVNQEKIEATVTNGVLRVTLPKADKVKVKKIPIKAD